MKIKPIIEVADVTFAYKTHPVINDVSFTINAGDYVGLVGPNGGGKSTLVKLILGLLKPQRGTILLFGQTRPDMKTRARIGYVPQHVVQASGAFPTTVFEVVLSGRTPLRGIGRFLTAEDRKAAADALQSVDLLEKKNDDLSTLSGGQRQRVFIARALAANPDMLILDEPVTGVDSLSRDRFYAVLRDANKKHNMTIILVSHDLDVVAQEAKIVLCVNQTLTCHGAPADLKTLQHLKEMYGENVKFVHNHV